MEAIPAAEPAPRERTCGTCTQCCKTMFVPEIAKPSGANCTHCVARTGCGIYETRPDSCRQFACLWLLLPDMPHRLRPDQTKVVFYKTAQRVVAQCDQANPMAWRREPFYTALKNVASHEWRLGGEVMAAAGLDGWLITPTREQPDIYLPPLPPGVSVHVDMLSNGRLVVRTEGEPDPGAA